MKNISTAAESAKNARAQKPITLVKVELPELTGNGVKILRLSTRAYTTGQNVWHGLVSDIGKIDAKVSADHSAVRADSHFRITLINFKTGLFSPDDSISSIFANYITEKSLVTVYQEFFEEGLAESDLIPLFVGRITSPEEWDDRLCRFDVISLSYTIGKQTVGRVLSISDYPDAPESSLGSFLPIPLGNIEKVPGIPIFKAVESRLTGVLLPSDTEARVHSTANFPDAGTIIIDGEEVAYTAKTATKFTGCTGIIDIHYRGDIVLRKLSKYPYLFYDKRYPVKSIGDIYNDGHLIDSSEYSKDATSGTVTFSKKPHFLESADSRFWYSHFDEADASDKSTDAENAIDSNDTSDAAELDKSHTPFAVKQTDTLDNKGQIGRAFVQIAHREDGLMPNDSLKVEIIDGANTINLGTLSKPGAGDTPSLSGNPDFSLNVVDSIAVNFVDKEHSHTNSANNATAQDASGGVGTYLHRVSAGWSQRIDFPDFSGTAVKIEYSISINMASTEVIHVFKINGVNAITFPANSRGTLTGSATINHQLNYITITSSIHHGARIQILSASRTVHFSPNLISSNKTGNSASKSGSVSVTKSAVSMDKVKISSSSNVFTDNLEITSHVGGDWNWFTGKTLKIKYNGTADGRKSYIIVARFVIEYAYSRVVYSEKITADVSGIVDSADALIQRPDAVYRWTIEKLLNESNSIIDAQSLTNAGNAYPSSYEFNGLINTKQEVRTLWKKLGHESRSVFYFDMGLAKIFFRSDVAASRSLNSSEIYKPDNKSQFSFKRTQLSQVVNSIDLKFKRDWTEAGNYQSISSAQDADSIKRFGQRENPDLFDFDFVAGSVMADDLRDFYLAEYKNIWSWVELEAFLSAVDIETYDTLSIGLESDGTFYKALVMGASRQFGLASKKRPDLIRLALRLSSIAGYIVPVGSASFALKTTPMSVSIARGYTTVELGSASFGLKATSMTTSIKTIYIPVKMGSASIRFTAGESLTTEVTNPIHDGSSWTRVIESASWSDRSYHASVVFDNKMWVLGGYDGSSYLNDIWSSADGISWTQATANAPWSDRRIHTSLVFDNKMWVLGGHVGSIYLNDVWSSPDGITWTRATANAPWSDRIHHTSLVFDNKIWVLGGYDASINNNDVWSSADGISWTQVTANASWSGRNAHTSLVFDNKMWVLGGQNSSYLNDVWSSPDGITWTRATASASWSGRIYHTSIVFDGKMWVLGGHEGQLANDIWSSSDGISWTEATADAPWSDRIHHTSFVFGGKMWVLGGHEGQLANDVWRTIEG